jgi:ribosome modulation factor
MQNSPFLRNDLKSSFERGYNDFLEDKNRECPYHSHDKREAWFDGQVLAATGEDIVAKSAICSQ